MPVQTTYNERIDAARVGQICNEEPSVLISRNVEDAAGIGFGLAVIQGVKDDGCTADLDATGNVIDAYSFLGISVRERSVRPETPNSFGQYEAIRIMRKGVIWVMTAGAVAAGNQATVHTGNGGFDDTSGGSFFAIPNSRWDTSTTGAGLAKLRLG